MAAYLIADTEITDHHTYDEYKRQRTSDREVWGSIPGTRRQTDNPRGDLAAPSPRRH